MTLESPALVGLLVLVAACAGLVGAWLGPGRTIRRWAWRMRGGDLSARLPVTRFPGSAELATDLNALAEMIQTLSRDTEEQLAEFRAHTTYQERTRLSGELHDSLAQTLASIRMQVRLLDETLHRGDEQQVWRELERIQESLEEADAELRELIAHFRVPIHEEGLISAVEHTVERFRRNCPELQVLLQTRWDLPAFPQEQEYQIVRILQEALANVRKHAHAHTVRILLQGDAADGRGRLLVEDDGAGFASQKDRTDVRGHIGMRLLRDRAEALRGQLQIESEPGEGTRVLLEFEARGAAI